MKHRAPLVFFCFVTLLALLSCSTEPEDEYTVKVSLAYPADAVIAEEDYVYVTPGESASFPLTIAEGYVYEGNDAGATYADGILTLHNVKYPTTVSLQITKSELVSPEGDESNPVIGEVTYDFLCQPGGTASSSHAAGIWEVGTQVTVNATAKDGYQFIGWSTGGELIARGTLVSEEVQYTFSLQEPTTLYANFKSETEAIVCYHLNGGHTKEGATVYYETFPLTYYYYPNAVPDLGAFTRAGHTLLEYSENEDGSGFVTCPGGKIFLNTDKIIHLWAQWSEWSPTHSFRVAAVDDGYYIVKYLGNEATVSVPGTIDGKPVIGIKAEAFDGCNVETLILNKSIRTIENKAFSKCQKLNTVYMCDSIVTVSNLSFYQCNSFKNFRYNAATKPVTSTGWGSCIRKLERVVYYYYEGADILAVLSGSSSWYGLDSPVLEELVNEAGHDYVVCNLGVHASIPQMIYLEFISHFVDEGDVIIQAPELLETTWGVNFHVRALDLMEMGYNVFRYLDISRYNNLFSQIQSVNKTRTNTVKKRDYTDYRADTNLYGDRLPEKKRQSDPYRAFDPPTYQVSGPTLNRVYAGYFNGMYKILTARGAKVYFSFSPLLRDSLSSTPEEIAAYHKAVDDVLLAPRISSITDYLLDRHYIYDNANHPTDEGATIRAKQLAADVIAQLRREENP